MTAVARRRLPGRADQVSYARSFVAGVLGDCPQLDDAVLLTSELCTNALEHTGSGGDGTFEVVVIHAPGSLRVEVCDDGAVGVPAVQSASDGSEVGRGLAIVDALAHRWGHRSIERGRCVFFELLCDHPIPVHSAPSCPLRRPVGPPCKAASTIPARRKELFNVQVSSS